MYIHIKVKLDNPRQLELMSLNISTELLFLRGVVYTFLFIPLHYNVCPTCFVVYNYHLFRGQFPSFGK